MALFSSSRRGRRPVPQGHVLLRVVISFFAVSTGLAFGVGALTLRPPQARNISPPTFPMPTHVPRRFPCAGGRVVLTDGQPVRNARVRFALLHGRDATTLRYPGAQTAR